MSDWTVEAAIEAAKKDPEGCGRQVYELSNRRIQLSNRVLSLEQTLARLVSHWREFGGMIVTNNAVNRDDYGFDEQIEAAAKIIGR